MRTISESSSRSTSGPIECGNVVVIECWVVPVRTIPPKASGHPIERIVHRSSSVDEIPIEPASTFEIFELWKQTCKALRQAHRSVRRSSARSRRPSDGLSPAVIRDGHCSERASMRLGRGLSRTRMSGRRSWTHSSLSSSFISRRCSMTVPSRSGQRGHPASLRPKGGVRPRFFPPLRGCVPSQAFRCQTVHGDPWDRRLSLLGHANDFPVIGITGHYCITGCISSTKSLPSYSEDPHSQSTFTNCWRYIFTEYASKRFTCAPC